MDSGDASVTGTVRPNWPERTADVEIAGKVPLSLLHDLPSFPPSAKITQGDMILNKVTVRVGKNTSPWDTVVYRVHTTRAAVDLTLEKFQDALDLTRFAAEGDATQCTLSFVAQSRQLGEVEITGDTDFRTKRFQGRLLVNLGTLNVAQWFEGKNVDIGNTILEVYGSSTFDIRGEFAQENAPSLRIDATRSGAPPLELQLLLSSAAGGWQLSSLDLTGELPISSFQSVFPRNMTANGAVPFTLRKRLGENQFTLSGDFSACDVRLGDVLHKPSGMGLNGAIYGVLSPESGWRAQRIELRGLNTVVRGVFTDNGLTVDTFLVDFADYAPVLPERLRLSGKAQVKFSTSPTQFQMVLLEANAAAGEDKVIRLAGGTLFYAESAGLQIENLHIQGNEIDCTLNISGSMNNWKGDLIGKNIRAERVQALYESFAQVLDTSKQQQTSPQPTRVTLKVQIDRLYYRRAKFDNANATIEFEPQGIHIRDIKATPYTGAVEGQAEIKPPEGGIPRRVYLDLRVVDADARAIDELAFLEPRQLTGTVSGSVTVAFPVGENVVPINATSGMVEFTARNGSYGRFGLTTKLLAMVRTTEVFRLRFPTFRDEGLAYDESAGVAEFNDGKMTLHAFTAKNPTMELSAAGSIDFPKDNTNLVVDVSLLGTVTGVMETVGLRGPARTIRTYSALRFQVSGPPGDATISPMTGAAVDKIFDTLTGGGRAVRDVLRDGAREAFRGIFGR